ncbi:MAG TPA: hypothetical protein VF351_07190 [Actinomycetota bacterium]
MVRWLILVVALVSCSRETSKSDDVTIRAALSPDPCELVSIADVEMATGARVQSSGPVPDEAMIVSGGPPLCEYEVPGRHGTIIVAVDPTGAEEFARLRNRDPSNTNPLKGLGDDAYSQAMASLSVLVGEGYFVLGTQLGAGEEGVRDLRTLAELALQNLDAA